MWGKMKYVNVKRYNSISQIRENETGKVICYANLPFSGFVTRKNVTGGAGSRK